MPIFKLQGTSNYAKISNDTLRDKRLSIESRGTLAYLLTHSDTFELSLEFLQTELGLGRDKLKKIVRELKENGYLSLVASHNKKGNFAGQEWFVFAESQNVNFAEVSFNRPTEKPTDGKTDRRLNRQTENTSDILKEKLREKKSNKEEEKETHTNRARARGNNFHDRGTFVGEEEAAETTHEVLTGLRSRIGMNVLPDEHTIVELAQWAFVNKITADQVLLCFDTLERQRKHPVHWRKGRTTAKTVMENLPTLDDLILETDSLSDGGSNGTNQSNSYKYPARRTDADVIRESADFYANYPN